MIKKSSLGKIGGFNFSKKTHPKYRKIEPYEKDPATGEILNPTLNNIFIQDGEEDFYQIIQSHKKECDIYEILRNCKASGTLDALGDPKKQTYTDITNMPQNIAETMEKLGSNEEEIKELTKQYNELKAKLDALPKETEETKEKGVVENE